MAIDPKKESAKWGDRQRAERKKAGERVKVKASTASSGSELKDWVKLFTNAALAECIRNLPASQRSNFEGDLHEETDYTTQMHIITVRLKHRKSRVYVSETMTIPLHLIAANLPDDAHRKGRQLGIALTHGVRNALKDASKKRDASDTYEEMVAREAVREKFIDDNTATKLKEAVRPACEICGKGDNRFPDWGPCPHEEVA